MPPTVMWFRRDLRLRDNPALLAAVAEAVGAGSGVPEGGAGVPEGAAGGSAGGSAGGVVPLFVLDPALWEPAGPARRAWLLRSLWALDESLGGALLIRRGDPAVEVPRVARAAAASAVHCAADFGPYGRRRDQQVEAALAAGVAQGASVPLVRTGSPYAVSPGRLRTRDGSPYRVFTPFLRAWVEHGWPRPAGAARGVRWERPLAGHRLPAAPALAGLTLPPAGEEAARRTWRRFRDRHLEGYAASRDRPDLARTSMLSAHLKYGEIHPRTLLADLADGARAGSGAADGAAAFRTELAWREFYADVLHAEPASARAYLRPEYATMPYDEGPVAAERFAAWQEGRTGYPFVDAGMRQLRAEGWMHNRLRMVAASFLVKDLHLDWRAGARYFLHWLRDGDLASNNHGWQWVAGSGTDAAPYFRVFNPVTQGRRFDPQGDYVRRYVPQLRGVPGPAVHEPWRLPDGVPAGYPERIVDHAAERAEALRRYAQVR